MSTTSEDRLSVEYVDVGEVSTHPSNPRQGDVGAIHESITRNGVYRPLIVQKSTGHILAGNHTFQAMLHHGLDKVPVIFRDVNDEQAKRILLADNRTADLGDYDDAQLAALLAELEDLEGTGYDGDDLDDLVGSLATDPDPDGPERWYTDKVDVPQYQIVGDEPDLDDLMDLSKTAELEAAIDKAGVPEDVAHFLRAAAQRHTVFNYRLVAEYYAHADATVQRLMEQSALVVIDVDDAIREGFTRFHHDLSMLEVEDREAL